MKTDPAQSNELLLQFNTARMFLAEEEEEEEEARIVVSLLDVTERRQAEEHLRLQSTALEAAANGIVITDRDGAILWVNPAFSQLTGYTGREVIGQNPRILKSGKQPSKYYQKLWETILSGQVWHDEIINHRKDDTLYTEEMTITPLRNEHGEITHFIAIKQDVTERKRAEEAVREADQRAIRDYERLLERLSQLAQTIGTARDLTMVYRGLREFAEASVPCNGLFVSLYDPQRQQRICIYSGGDGEEDDVLTLPPLPMNDSPQSRAIATGQVVVTDDFQAAVAGKPVVTLGIEQDPRLPQSSIAVPLTVLGRVIGAFEVQSIERAAYQPEHVTAMRMAANLAAIATENVQMLERERELRLGAEMSEERYRTLAEAAQDAIFIIGRDDRVEYVNSFAAGQFGSRAEELIGKTRAALFPPYVVEEQSRSLQEVFETGNSIYAEAKTVYPTGEVWIGTRLAPIRNVTGEVRAVLGIARDTTERKRAEEQIRQRLGELEVLYQSGLALSQSLKPKEIAQRIIDLLDQNLGWHHTTVRLYHPQDETLELLAFNQPGLRSEQEKHAVEEYFKTSIAKKGQGLSGWVIEHGQSVRTSDLMNDARYVETFSGLRSGLYVPIIIGERTIGVISIESEEENAFSEADERLTVTLANQAASALENARLFEETRQRLTRIQSLRNIDMAISGSTDLHVTFNVALDEIVNQLGIDAACILRLDLHTQTLEYAAGRGFRTHTIEKSLVRLGEGHAGRAALERRPVHIADLPATGAEFGRAGLLACEGFKTYHAIPLIAKGQVLGVLEIFHRAAFEGNGEWLDFLETLAGQTAIAMDNASLFQGLERSNINLLQAYDATIEGWSQAMDLRDKETEGHTQRVTKLTEQLARAIGMSHEEIVHARRGALLHDIGKIGVPDLILLKADKLTEEEWILMKSHPQFAYNMLSPIAYLKPALDIPYCHHEKWDGTGYPRGLKGEQIPLAARLFAIVDVYDALTSDRPYRKAWTKKKTFTYIREQSGTHFDPAVVDAFLAMQLPKRKK